MSSTRYGIAEVLYFDENNERKLDFVVCSGDSYTSATRHVEEFYGNDLISVKIALAGSEGPLIIPASAANDILLKGDFR